MNLVDDVFQADDISSDVLFDLSVRFDMDSLIAYFAMKLFVDEFADQLLIGLTPGDIVFDPFELPDVGGSASEENSCVNFPEVEFGEDDFLLPGDVGGSPDSDDQQEFANSIDLAVLSFKVEPFVLSILPYETSYLELVVRI